MQTGDIALEKGLPCNLDAERFVLGAILLDDTYYIQAASALEAEDFALEKHRRIFAPHGRHLRRAASASTASRWPMS